MQTQTEIIKSVQKKQLMQSLTADGEFTENSSGASSVAAVRYVVIDADLCV